MPTRTAPEARRRVVHLLIQSCETPARGPRPASPDHEARYEAMLRGIPAGIAAAPPPDTRR
ncbi:hypothetical protein [Actinoplanes sp. ATCC 53533]|uniref:hypothetical protein n=1 Tax=Actinoplanes sp. ATCC 53533 TaxID=1288362 RepID=UPI0018F70C59|nr:hypothetical protein [Actinoplanes sp. ATCC 53533]